jgi:hypothetical protein
VAKSYAVAQRPASVAFPNKKQQKRSVSQATVFLAAASVLLILRLVVMILLPWHRSRVSQSASEGSNGERAGLVDRRRTSPAVAAQSDLPAWA